MTVGFPDIRMRIRRGKNWSRRHFFNNGFRFRFGLNFRLGLGFGNCRGITFPGHFCRLFCGWHFNRFNGSRRWWWRREKRLALLCELTLLRSEIGEWHGCGDLGLARKVLMVCCNRKRCIQHFHLLRGFFNDGSGRWWRDKVGKIFHQQLHVLRIGDERIQRLFNFDFRSPS